MHKSERKLSSLIGRTLALFVVVSTALLSSTPYIGPTAQAQELEPVLGDCFGGVLTSEPLHCYILGKAEQRRVIDVEAIYEAPSRVLYVMLSQQEPLSESALRFLEVTSGEYFEVERPAQWEYWHRICQRRSLKECALAFAQWRVGVMPLSIDYASIHIRTGGPEARRKEPGWGSWRQLWPESEGGGVEPHPSRAFDVSDIDTTNFPELDCYEEFPYGVAPVSSCRAWERNLGTYRMAGVHADRLSQDQYIQIVMDLPGDHVELEALKEEIVPTDRRYGYEIHLISVPYDFGELWRWSVILERFANSTGNTIGITRSGITANDYPHLPSPVISRRGARPSSSKDVSTWRETVYVGALDAEQVADALPDLLPQLGIPTDAVTIVFEDYKGSRVAFPGSSTSTEGNSDRTNAGADVVTQVASNLGVPPWTLVTAMAAVGAAVLASLIFLALRLSRRRRT